ncbi:MAG TPA: mechanosensitive ion channel family protein [Dehalococcoidia bacterium]|nr:mechanosensitive ion channel family protein [Dehalococcoidia bacterium]
MLDWFMETGIRIAVIIVVALILFVILRFTLPLIVKRFVSRRMAGDIEAEIKKRTDTLSSILINIVGIIIAIIAILTILPEFGVNITTLIAGLGVGGLAIAFAAQNLVRDFITGFFILLEDQYRVGDVVAVAGIAGLVEEIALRRTILRDLDGVVHSVPNGKVEISSNMTKKFSRVNLDISVGYGENLDRVIEVINAVCYEIAEDPKWKPDLITTPAVVRVNNLGDSGIDIKIMGDTKPSRQWDVMGELRLRIKKTFDNQGIEIPWPHTKVYFGNTPATTNEN